MTKYITMTAVAASALALAACSNSDEAAPADGATDTVATAEPATPVTMPDPIAQTRTYRCADSSVVTVDFLSRGDLAASTTANIRTQDEAGASVGLTRADADSRYEAEGYSVSDNGDRVTIEVPGKNAQLCKA